MEHQRTLRSLAGFSLAGVACAAALGWYLATSRDELRELSPWLPYLLCGALGLAAGALMGWRLRYFPSWEGLFTALSVLAPFVIHDLQTLGEFRLGLDNLVEFLLTFESLFAAFYLAAFLVFVLKGGGFHYPWFVGLRYLRFKMITAISVAGVALGVAAMIVVLSVMSGFENDLRQKIVGTNAHAIVQKRGSDFSEHRVLLDKIRRVPGVTAASPFIYNEVMVSSDYNISGVILKGIDPATAGAVTELDRGLREGTLDLLAHPERIRDYVEEQKRKSLPRVRTPDNPLGDGRPPDSPDADGESDEPRPRDGLVDEALKPAVGADLAAREEEGIPEPQPIGARAPRQATPGILIGVELKKILKVKLGDRINVVSPLSEELGPSGPVPKARAFRVAGVFYTGMYEYDAKWVYVTLADAQDFFGLGETVTGIALKLDNLERAQSICAEILSTIDGWPYFTRTWYDMNKNLFSALKMEKVAMFILVVIVTLVSAFGIISTLIMLVWEKIKEIAILKSMGATADGIMKIFQVEGILIGLVGTGLGLLLGLGSCLFIRSIGLTLNPEVYYIEKLPVNMDPLEFVLIAGIALHISFIATIYPSGRASRLRPVEGLRYD